jgi:hypothetical protein
MIRISISRPTGCADNHDADGLCLAMPVIIQKFDENFETNAKNVVQVLTTNDVTVAHNEVQVMSYLLSREMSN